MADYRILVTGSREFTDYLMILDAIVEAIADTAGTDREDDRFVVVTGHAPGADLLAEKAATVIGVTIDPHPYWRQYGKRGGILRNAHMVALGADICLAFFKDGALNRGTSDCAERARKAGIPVRKYHA